MKPRIVIIVEGGNIQDVLSDSEVEVTLIDWDNIKDGDGVPELIEEGNYSVSLATGGELSDIVSEANSEIERMRLEMNDI